MSNNLKSLKLAVIGVGNCASSLLQGITFYASSDTQEGLMHYDIGGYRPSDIDVVLAVDVDARKVGYSLEEAVFAFPNNTKVFCPKIKNSDLIVQMGAVLDGVSPHMEQYENGSTFQVSSQPESGKEDIVRLLRESGADVLVNFLPVGSVSATHFYAECALEAGVGVVNCIPVFLASDPDWAARFSEKGLPVIGDDIKAQLGATIVHRTLTDLFKKRGVVLERTYQLNVGGNTDFLNMLNRDRLEHKKISKTEAVQSAASRRIADKNIHVGPSDYVPWLNDNKLCFLRMEGLLFGRVPMDIDVRLSVEDSPNSAAISIDAIRCCKLAMDRGLKGAITAPSSFLMKSPPQQLSDDEGFAVLEQFIGERTAQI